MIIRKELNVFSINENFKNEYRTKCIDQLNRTSNDNISNKSLEAYGKGQTNPGLA